MSELSIPERAPLAVRLGDHELTPGAADRIRKAPSENTLRAYRKWTAVFTEWCEAHGVTALPATPQTLANFVSWLADENKGVPTIKIAVAAVRWGHALAGHKGTPDTELANLTLRTHAQEQADEGKRGKQATPILLDALWKMLDACPPDTLRGCRDRALLVIGWSGMFRRSELAAMRISDVVETDDGLTIYVPRSKTDKDARGAEVSIPPGSHPESDPVRVRRNYIEALAEHGITSGRLFRSIGTGGKVDDEITGYAINLIVKDTARRANLPNPDGYTAHGLRAGGATAAYRNGAAVSTIAEHGRWAKNSPVVLGYIRAVDKWKDNPMRGIGL